MLQGDYLEAAPDDDDDDGAEMTTGPQSSTAPESTSAQEQPGLLKAEEQSGEQGQPAAAKGSKPTKARPHVVPRPRAAKSASQKVSEAGAQQKQQQQAPVLDEGQNGFTRMMQEAGVTPEEMDEAY